MSNLCYNCGDCHLPRPCPQELKGCGICNNMGHAYNFCPLSVRVVDSNYQFWALCHNCDKWHLPDACSVPLHKCFQCGHGGHKEYFCPVKPLSRDDTAGLLGQDTDTKTGVKRQRTIDSDENAKEDGTGVNALRPEAVRAIKVEATHEVLQFVTHGFSHGEILGFMTRELPAQAPLGKLQTSFAVEDVAAVASMAGKEQALPTPASPLFVTSPNGQFAAATPAQSTAPSLLPPVMGDATGTPGPAANLGKACAECKAVRRKCVHRDGVVTAGPDPVQMADQFAIPGADVHGTGAQANTGRTQAIQSLHTVTPSGAVQASAMGNIPAAYDPVQGFAKGNLAHPLNATAANRNPYLTSTQFDFGTSNFATVLNNGQVGDLNNAGGGNGVVTSVEKPQVGTTPAETGAFVKIPNPTDEPAEEVKAAAKAAPKTRKPRGRPAKGKK